MALDEESVLGAPTAFALLSLQCQKFSRGDHGIAGVRAKRGAVQDVPRAAQHVQILISVQSLLVDLTTSKSQALAYPSNGLLTVSVASKVQQLFHRTLYGNACL